MARLKHGINGPFSGKVGSVIGVVKDGQQQIKGPHKNRTTNISDKEKHNRKRFRTAQSWLLPMVDYVREGFSVDGKTTTSFIRAVGKVLRTALIDEDNVLKVDPKLVSISEGTLGIPQNMQCKIENEYLVVTWDAVPAEKKGDDDQVFIVAYSTSDQSVCGTLHGALARTGIDAIAMSSYHPGNTYHVYVAMVSADRKNRSESVYLGEIAVP